MKYKVTCQKLEGLGIRPCHSDPFTVLPGQGEALTQQTPPANALGSGGSQAPVLKLVL